MYDIDPRALKPQAGTDMPSVEVPTIRVVPNRHRSGGHVVVQWFGQAQALNRMVQDFGHRARITFEKTQFLFPVSLGTYDTHWMGAPEMFRVIFLGQLKDWPNKKAIPTFNMPPDTWMLYVTATHLTVKLEKYGDDRLSTFATPLAIILGDGVYGVITPKEYCDLSVIQRTEQDLHLKTSP